MRILFSIFFTSFLLSIPAMPAAALTLREAVDNAIENHRSIKIDARRISIAKDKADEAIATVMPKLSLNGRYDVRSNAQGANTDSGGFITGDRQVGTIDLSLKFPVYDFGMARNRYNAELIRVKSAALNADKGRLSLILSVKEAYIAALETKKITLVIEESIKTIEQQLVIANDFYKQGMTTRSDILVAEVELAGRRQELFKAENNFLVALTALSRLTGQDIPVSVTLEDITDVTPMSSDIHALLKTAREKRPEIAILRREKEAAEAEYKSIRANGKSPYIYGYGDYIKTTDKFILNDQWVSAGIAVQYPIFDGGLVSSRLEQKTKNIRELEDLANELILDIDFEVKKLYLELTESQKSVPVAEKSIELAMENLRITRDQYTAGLVTGADVLKEEDRLSQAKLNYFHAIYDYQRFYARIAHATASEISPIQEEK